MVDSLFPSFETTVDDASPESRQKRRKISETAKEAESSEINQESLKRWRTNRVQQIYASKLVEALRRVRQRSNDGGKITSAAREIHDTANRVLTASARGTTQWSRAVLATRVRASLKKHKKEKLAGTPKPRKDTSTEKKRIKLPAVERKLKILGRLVPGCRKVTVPNLLDEATDYIAALEMQVRAMESLAELLAATAPRSTLIRP
ncbi:PREDICTED: LOW QUALITY PROTEIN: transcription factor bHLH149-like [Brassica oleracea var. oleracea]|uniref:LOW QUALITY PROTEIN: transcription factor bHLH149-like n=1 Tax=Brassica oleracea var. oleracea TaxID=109376 RepID=UPI0006A70792|nr:PREDICTED: LOW QUALITY PROTEIN: transcription factor bHLH149-like [Brassica oleracea var. oleracea]